MSIERRFRPALLFEKNTFIILYNKLKINFSYSPFNHCNIELNSLKSDLNTTKSITQLNQIQIILAHFDPDAEIFKSLFKQNSY